MAIRSITSDPLRNFKFHVDIHHNLPGYGNILINMGFMAASGLAASTEVISYREGGDNTTPRKMPGQTDFPPISLTRGMVGVTGENLQAMGIDSESSYGLGLWQWYRQIFNVIQGKGVGLGGSDFRADAIYIKLFEHPRTTEKPNGKGYGKPVVRWKLYNAWPASIAFSDLDAGGNGVMVNNMTLMYEGFDIKASSRGIDAWED